MLLTGPETKTRKTALRGLRPEAEDLLFSAPLVAGYSAVIAVIPELNLSFAGVWSGQYEGGAGAPGASLRHGLVGVAVRHRLFVLCLTAC